MANLRGRKDFPVEITWMTCNRCGALIPRIDLSRGGAELQGLCCGWNAADESRRKPVAWSCYGCYRGRRV